MGLRSVLDDGNAVFGGYRHDRVDVRRKAVQMHWYDRLRSRGKSSG
jgi:hypothetical protein